MPSAMDALKTATATHHERLERRVDIEHALRSKDAYRELLERLYGVYRPLEAELAPFAVCEAKLPRLETDLLALGTDPATLPHAERVPRAGSLGEALGVAYVIEGSALGGALIGSLVRRRLGLTSAFFAGGPGIASRWRAFGEVVERHAPVSTTAAIATFEAMEGWLCP